MHNLTYNGLKTCSATNIENSNMNGTSRGRKIHLESSNGITVCNMKKSEYMNISKSSSFVSNGFCLICFKGKSSKEIINNLIKEL